MIPDHIKTETKELLLKALEDYFREAEEHEDADILTGTKAKERVNDFVDYMYHYPV